MKLKLLIYILILGVPLFSCSKDEDTAQTRTQLLTSKTWIYNEYFTGYNEANTVLLYKKGKSSNILDLSGDVLNFKEDGTFSRIDYMGQAKSGTWQFVNAETQVSTTEDGVTHISNIIVLTENMYTWHDVPYGTYGEMIPK